MTYLQELKSTLTGTGSHNTPEGAIIRAGSKHTTKTITLSANNTTASVNVFQITGTIKALSLHGEVLDATTLTNCTSVYFDLWDGSVSSPITKITGAAMSGFNVGAFFIKDAALALALTTANNDQNRVIEAASDKVTSTPFLAVQKIATNTYIRFIYTTTDAPINAQLKVDLEWQDIDSGQVTAV